MFEKVKNFISAHLDFRIYPVTWVAIIVAILVAPCVLYLPEKYGYENGLLENLQMVTLLVGFLICIFYSNFKKTPEGEASSPAKKYMVKFFYFAAMVIGILALREVNCGRTLFFPVPGEVNTYYGWKDIKYGWLAHPLYGLYMAYVAFYFLKNKLFITLWQLIKNIKFPVWNIILMIIGMTLGMIAEKSLHNMVFEEITELLFYVSLVGIICIYAFNRNFKTEEE